MKGLAAVVPFDANDGWYVRVSASQGGLFSDESKGYADSGSVNTFSIYNVGSDDKISIHQVSETLAKKFNLKTSKKIIKLNKIDYYIPNINKAKKKLNLNLKYNSLQSIKKTISFYLNNVQKLTNKNY